MAPSKTDSIQELKTLALAYAEKQVMSQPSLDYFKSIPEDVVKKVITEIQHKYNNKTVEAERLHEYISVIKESRS